MTDFIQPDWNENDSGNTGVSPNGVAGSYSPSSVAPIIRAIRGAAKRNFVRSNPIYTTTGTGAAYTLTFIAGPVSYQRGEIYRVWAHADNTGPASLNINTLGAKSILSAHGKPLVAGQILAGDVMEVVFDGTSFLLLSNEKSKATVQTSVTINSGSGVSPALALSPNNVIRAALSSSANGGIAVTLSNANSAIVKSLIVPETGNMSFGGDIIWTSGNMGANSAMNADLLDGQHGAFYSDLTNSTGTLPNARLSGNYSFANLDLSNSFATAAAPYVRFGLNLGRNAGTAAEPSAQSQGYLGVSSAGSVYLSRRTTAGGADTASLSLTSDTATGLAHNVGSSSHTVWTAGNHGVGSGLNADLLDGQHGAFYQNLANSTGTLPNARISGAYDGITNLSMTGALGITSASPTINFIDTTAGSYNTRLIVDANNWYLQKQADGTTSWTTFAQFEMDTTNAYLNGQQIWTAGNHLNIGTSAASARTAMGLGGLATSDISDLFYTGTSNSNTNFPVGSYIGVFTDSNAVARNATIVPCLSTSDSHFYRLSGLSGAGTALAGTWRTRGGVDADSDRRFVIAQRV